MPNPPRIVTIDEMGFITIRGRGSHAALPHLAIDPVPIACQMVQAFQTIVTRNKRPTDTAVISVTTIHTGEATNVVPDQAVIEGTVAPSRSRCST